MTPFRFFFAAFLADWEEPPSLSAVSDSELRIDTLEASEVLLTLSGPAKISSAPSARRAHCYHLSAKITDDCDNDNGEIYNHHRGCHPEASQKSSVCSHCKNSPKVCFLLWSASMASTILSLCPTISMRLFSSATRKSVSAWDSSGNNERLLFHYTRTSQDDSEHTIAIFN